MNKTFAIPIILAAFLLPLISVAQELHADIQELWWAEVVEIIDQREEEIVGTGVERTVQTLRARILEGERKGEVVQFDNDFIELKSGQKFYLNFMETVSGEQILSVQEVDRASALIVLIVFFTVAVIAFGGLLGVRALISLAGSLLVVVYMLVPALVAGYPPVAMSVALATLILALAIFVTHGFTGHSFAAFGGTVIAVILTGLLAALAVSITSLTGFISDESTYLNFSTGGRLDFAGLLLAGIIIGALGVLDDIAITQASAVRELFGANSEISRREVFVRAIKIGRDHVSALVNTLVLAYTGTALPLLLLFYHSSQGAMAIANREVFAAEIVRTLVGSIGLIMTVPITTAIAVIILRRR